MADTIQIRYGSYTHPAGEVVLSVSRVAISGMSKNPWAERVQINMTGQLLGTSVSDLNTKIDNLISGYAYDNLDFKVLLNGSTSLRLSVLSSATLGGIRVIRPPSFPSNRDAAYVTFMPFSIGLEAEIAVTDPETLLESFVETLAFSGGGPIDVHLVTAVGLPQKQRPRQHLPYEVIQSGSAMGLYTYPTVPLPLWPADLVKAPAINQTGGRLVGSGSSRRYMHFGITWRYEFKSALPMLGNPNNWGSE